MISSSKIPFLKGVYLVLILCFYSCDRSAQSTIHQPAIDVVEKDYGFFRTGYFDNTFTIKEVVQVYLDRIAEIDDSGPTLNAVLEINPDAMVIADSLDGLSDEQKQALPILGMVILLKDNIDTQDKMSTTAGSRALLGSKPLKDSYVAKSLREAGAVIIGKANLSEWANFRGELSSSGWSGLGGQTKNPYVLDRNPCGSSSGSGTAVSANLCMVAIGTETNGSIVCPSNNNGVVGVKPTVGLVSRTGIIPISFTQDTAGPMARNLYDATVCLGAMVGVDSSDAKTMESADRTFTDYTKFLTKDGLKGKRIGWYTRPRGRHYKVDTLMQKAVYQLKTQGVEIVELERITLENMGSHSFQVMLYEYKDGLNNYFKSLGPNAPIKNLEELIAFNEEDSIELLYHDQRFLEMALEKEDLDSDDYISHLNALMKGSRDNGIDRIMDQHNLDAIIAPTGGPAWKTDLVNGDSFHVGSSSPAARAGYPNITVPMGFVGDLPVGISFFGRAWSEPLLLEIAYGYEQSTMHRQEPKFIESE